MEKQWPQLIIAMKGHPGTGKSTLSRAISTCLQFPLIDKDDIRDNTLSLQSQYQITPSTLNDLSYLVLWQITETQLQLGLSVVIDSPHSCRANLNKLVELARAHGARVVIVECRPKDEREWRRRLEERARSGGDKGHKPATWEEMGRIMEGYNGCWDYEIEDAKKIVVDTTARDEQEKLVNMVIDFIKSSIVV